MLTKLDNILMNIHFTTHLSMYFPLHLFSVITAHNQNEIPYDNNR